MKLDKNICLPVLAILAGFVLSFLVFGGYGLFLDCFLIVGLLDR